MFPRRRTASRTLVRRKPYATGTRRGTCGHGLWTVCAGARTRRGRCEALGRPSGPGGVPGAGADEGTETRAAGCSLLAAGRTGWCTGRGLGPMKARPFPFSEICRRCLRCCGTCGNPMFPQFRGYFRVWMRWGRACVRAGAPCGRRLPYPQASTDEGVAVHRFSRCCPHVSTGMSTHVYGRPRPRWPTSPQTTSTPVGTPSSATVSAQVRAMHPCVQIGGQQLSTRIHHLCTMPGDNFGRSKRPVVEPRDTADPGRSGTVRPGDTPVDERVDRCHRSALGSVGESVVGAWPGAMSGAPTRAPAGASTVPSALRTMRTDAATAAAPGGRDRRRTVRSGWAGWFGWTGWAGDGLSGCRASADGCGWSAPGPGCRWNGARPSGRRSSCWRA